MRRAVLLISLLVTTAAYAEEPAPQASISGEGQARAIEWDQISEDNLRILQVKLDKYELDDVITAYQLKEGIYIPLGMFSQVVGLAIRSEPEREFAEGFILQEERHFILDVPRHEITVSGKTEVLDRSYIKLLQDDIYLHEDVLQKYLPLKLNVDLYASYVFIKPTEPFPLQLRREREERIGRIKSRRGLEERNYPEVNTDYRPYSIPFIDQSVGLNYKSDPVVGETAQLNYSTYMTSDLANMEGSLYMSGTTDNLFQDFRLTFSKHDPDAGLLGAMQATEYSFGHVNLAGANLVSNNQTALPGATMSNFPTTQQLDFDKHTFRGDLLPGWEVELYQNNALIAYQSTPVNGQYAFEDIPLLFGNNYFRLVFYGPHGETREEVYNFVLNQSLTKAGEYHYRVGLAADDTLPGGHANVHYDYGINKYLTAQANVTSVPLVDGQHSYLTLGLAGFTNSVFAKTSMIADMNGGSALDLSMQSRLGAFNIGLGHSMLDNFTSEVYQQTDQVTSRSNVRLDTAIPKSFLPRLPISLEYRSESYESGNYRNEIVNRISSYAKRLAVTNEVKLIDVSNATNSQTGLLQISSHQYRYTLRGDIYYEMAPNSQINSIALNYTGKNLGPYYLDLGLSRSSDDTMQYLFGVHKTKGDYAFDVNLSYKTNGEIALTSSMSMNFGYDNTKDEWFYTSRPIASKGAAVLDVYVDQNDNNKRDEDEPVIDNVVIEVNGVRKPEKTDAEGNVMLTELPVYQHVDFSIATDSLADPLWVPKIEGVNAVLRPGYILEYSFPVMETGEVDGTVYLRDENGQTKPVGDVVLEVIDDSGKVVATTKSAYDGFYVLSKIPVGGYFIRVSEEQRARLGLRAQQRRITLGRENLFINGIDVVVQLK